MRHVHPALTNAEHAVEPVCIEPITPHRCCSRRSEDHHGCCLSVDGAPADRQCLHGRCPKQILDRTHERGRACRPVLYDHPALGCRGRQGATGDFGEGADRRQIEKDRSTSLLQSLGQASGARGGLGSGGGGGEGRQAPSQVAGHTAVMPVP